MYAVTVFIFWQVHYVHRMDDFIWRKEIRSRNNWISKITIWPLLFVLATLCAPILWQWRKYIWTSGSCYILEKI